MKPSARPVQQLAFRHNRPTIGVLAGWQFYNITTSLNYLMPVYKGIIRAAQELDCNLLLGCGVGVGVEPTDSNHPAWPTNSAEGDFVPIGPWNTDGLIIFTPLHSLERSAYVQSLRARGFPVQFVGSGEQGPTLAADNAGGVREALRHLVGHGHREIAFIAGSQDDLAGDTGERLNAYLAALEAHGLPNDPRRVVYGGHVYTGGYAALRQILGSGVGFTAVLSSNDEMALGAMQALKEAGREIPRDVAVIGFDNRLEDAAQKPSLSSVQLPLFNMGRRALESLVAHVREHTGLTEIVRVETRLIARESCGCGGHVVIPAGLGPGSADARPDLWVEEIAASVLRQAQNLEESEVRQYCTRLMEAFTAGIERGDRELFISTLEDVLQHATGSEDDAHIWQDAVSLIGAAFEQRAVLTETAGLLIRETLDRARLTISAHTQRHHRQYVSNLGWMANRLSLLTAGLLAALDEREIYTVLGQHLPGMDIHRALIGLYEPEGEDPTAWSLVRDVFAPGRAATRQRSRDFPPRALVPDEQPFHLALIPFARNSGQPGFVVFDSAHIDQYGAIVQQIGGALNTARLYREATEGRRMAEEANRMKSRFLSVIGHELRTPLNLIVGLSEIVLKSSDETDPALPDATQKDIERIHTYSQHLGGLIGDVLDLATSDAGQLRLNNDFVEVGQALQIIAESGRQLAADKGLEWQADLPESGPWVWGDRMRLRQVALNLINNAVKFTERGSVSLRVETGPDTVSVLVSDTGLGISSQDQQVIFEEFRQADNSVSLGYGGLGLGLAISKRLVELHGGVIGVRSSGQAGAGSTFYFTLPGVPAPVERSRAAGLPAGVRSVLVLTGQPQSSDPLLAQLQQRGIRARVHSLNSAAGWQPELFDFIPDAVLVEAGAETSPGWNALKAVKGSPLARDIPVLFFKSLPDRGGLLELNYLTKPIEPVELTHALDQQWLLASSERPTRNILVVDDETNTLDLNARIVQSHSPDNHVLKARNGREALEMLERESVDLVLLDLQMPEIDGFAVLERMRERESLRKIPVIVVTGKVLTEENMARLNRGVTAVLEKGLFSLDETAEHITAALERKRRLSGEAQRLVRKAMAYIHEHYAESISRREIAQHVSISEDHLTFCFRQELGATPIEYLQRYRVHQARLLLKDSERSISEIALDVGFSDSGYFSRIFRRIAGMSPEAFRRSA